MHGRRFFQLAGLLALLALLNTPASAQEPTPVKQDPVLQTQTAPSDKEALKVNWLYGSFVPKEVPLIPLTPEQRWKLYVRSTYTTWGIYVKTVLFTAHDQVANTPQEWGRTAGGFAKRAGTRQAQFVIQNSLSAYGNAVLGWEPRYDRCRCDGFWPRTRHAIARNFVTYGGAEQSLRPQLMPYAAAFGAAVTVAAWTPHSNLVVKGYQGAITQVFVGAGVNWLAEFAPEIMRTLHRKRGLN
jgi:hypothetical protein